MRKTVILILGLLLLSSCSITQSELDVSVPSAIESINLIEEKVNTSNTSLVEIELGDAPTVEPGVLLSLYGIPQNSDESELLSYCWIDIERIAISVAIDYKTRIYEVDFARRELVRILDTDLDAPLYLFMSDGNLMARHLSETTTTFYWLDSNYKAIRSLRYDDAPIKDAYYQIAYRQDYSLRAFGEQGVIYIQNPDSAKTEKVYEKDIIVDAENDIYPEYLTPADFSADGNTIICANNGTGMGGTTSGGGLIDLTDYKVTLFDTYSFNYVVGLSPCDNSSILALCFGEPGTRGEAEFINMETLKSTSFSFTESFCNENKIDNNFMLDSFPDGTGIFCCVLRGIDIPLFEKTHKQLYHMFLYDFSKDTTRVIYKNYASENSWMEQALFLASETQDKVVGVCLNEETDIYQIALFDIER